MVTIKPFEADVQKPLLKLTDSRWKNPVVQELHIIRCHGTFSIFDIIKNLFGKT